MMKQLAFLLLIPLAGFAQQDPTFTFNNDFNTYSNPSFMVNDHELNVTAQHREQWVGFDGAPRTTLVTASYNVDKAWSAFGVVVAFDKLGAQKTSTVVFNYAFDGKIGEHHIIPGVQIGAVSSSLDGSVLDPIDGNDPNIIGAKGSGSAFDIGLSIAYRFRGLAVGFSTTHLTRPTIEYEVGNATSEFTVARNYYGLVAYNASIGKYLRIKPITFVRTDVASFQFDQFLWFGTRNLNKYFDGVSLGVGYRSDDAVMVGVEFKMKWFTLGYSYDITTSGLKANSNGSHEFYLRFHLFKTEQPLVKTE